MEQKEDDVDWSLDFVYATVTGKLVSVVLVGSQKQGLDGVAFIYNMNHSVNYPVAEVKRDNGLK